jgi:hypothetical protein
MGALSFIVGCLFWWSVRDLDAQEDRLNNLDTGHVGIRDVNVPHEHLEKVDNKL